jgi:hypothetical protein
MSEKSIEEIKADLFSAIDKFYNEMRGSIDDYSISDLEKDVKKELEEVIKYITG